MRAKRLERRAEVAEQKRLKALQPKRPRGRPRVQVESDSESDYIVVDF
jgi:hypothetical protein